GKLFGQPEIGLGQLHLPPEEGVAPAGVKEPARLQLVRLAITHAGDLHAVVGNDSRFNLRLLPDFAPGFRGVFEEQLIEPGALDLKGAGEILVKKPAEKDTGHGARVSGDELRPEFRHEAALLELRPKADRPHFLIAERNERFAD